MTRKRRSSPKLNIFSRIRRYGSIPTKSTVSTLRAQQELPLISSEPEAFLGGLAEFEKYLTSLETASDFSGTELRRIMSAFQEPFGSHFHAEIKTIAALADHPNAPKSGTPKESEAANAFKSWGKSTVMKAGTLDVVPFFLLNLDGTRENGLWANWPPIPPPIKWGLVNLGGSFHSGYWKFASCSGGKPKELYAVGATSE